MNVTRLQDSCRVALRPTHLLPPKRLSTPRSARGLSTTNRGLLPGAPTPTGTGLTPAGTVQLSGRTPNTLRATPIRVGRGGVESMQLALGSRSRVLSGSSGSPVVRQTTPVVLDQGVLSAYRHDSARSGESLQYRTCRCLVPEQSVCCRPRSNRRRLLWTIGVTIEDPWRARPTHVDGGEP